MLYLSLAGEDYNSTIFFVELISGETSVCTQGTIIEDDVFEGTESFYLVFTSSDYSTVLNADIAISQNEIQTQIYISDNSGTTTLICISTYCQICKINICKL